MGACARGVSGGHAAIRHSLQEEIPISLLLLFCLLYAASCCAQTELSHRPSCHSPALQGERGTLQQALDLANRQLAAAHRDMETLRLQVLFQCCAVQVIYAVWQLNVPPGHAVLVVGRQPFQPWLSYLASCACRCSTCVWAGAASQCLQQQAV